MSTETTWEHTCPWCGVHNDSAGGPCGHYPDDGSVLLCWHCRQLAIAVLTPYGLTARMPTKEELAALRADPQVRQAYAAISESLTPEQAADLIAPPESWL